MAIGLCTVELYLPGRQSLKDKRQVLSSLITRLRGRLNISVAEVGDQDLWQKAVIAIVCVANETGRVNQILDHGLNLIRANPSLELLRSNIEIL